MTNLVALIFGAVIVLLFSFERFNRTTDETGQKLQRLVDLLSPDKLRSRRVVLNAYVFYAFTFLLIYMFLCAYAELIPALGGPNLSVGASKLPVPASTEVARATTGFTPIPSKPDIGSALGQQTLSSGANAAAKKRAFDIGIDAKVSLAVALMIIGLAPAFPVLQRFESWMRASAHRLAGIPTRVLGIRDDLRAEILSLPNDAEDGEAPESTLLIPRSDWKRMSHYRGSTTSLLDAPEDFHNDIALIFAISAWVLKGKLKLGNSHERERFVKLEEALSRRKNSLIHALDEKTAFLTAAADTPATQAKEEGAPGELVEAEENRSMSWERLSVEVSDLADDLCTLLALYAEHEIIVSEQHGARGNSVQSPVALQRDLARRKLEEFLKDHLGDHTGPARSRSFGMVTGLWTFAIVMVITLIWSQFPGRFESLLQRGADSGAYWRILTYTFTTFLSFCIPITVALAIRDGGRELRRWRNMRLGLTNWTVFLPQAALVVAVSWAFGTVCILGAALWEAGVARGWDTNTYDVWATLRFSFAYNGPTPLRGATLALVIVVLLDAWRVPYRLKPWEPDHRTSLIWAAGTALLMALVGGITRYMSSWAGALQAAVPRESLDDIDRGLIAYAAIFSAIIGFSVVFAVSEVLLYQRRTPGSVNTRAMVV